MIRTPHTTSVEHFEVIIRPLAELSERMARFDSLNQTSVLSYRE